MYPEALTIRAAEIHVFVRERTNLQKNPASSPRSAVTVEAVVEDHFHPEMEA